MRYQIDSAQRLATINVAAGETLDLIRLDLTLFNITLDPAGVFAIDIIMPVALKNEHAEALAERFGFRITGTISEGTNLWVKMRTNPDRTPSVEAPTSPLAINAAPLPPSGIELAARRLQDERFKQESETIDERTARIQAEADRLKERARNEETLDDRVKKIEREAQILRTLRDQPLEGVSGHKIKEATEAAEHANAVLDNLRRLQRQPESEA
jgi:hypothetical protein